MKRLGLLDDAFLRLESRRTPLHIGTLMLFEPPPKAGKNFAEGLAARLRRSTHAAAPFNRRLVQRRGMHYWEEDEEFDLDHHFAHTSLPHPGRIRELLEMVSRIHSSHLDREYPLWRMYLISGLEDGRIAVYMKIHHSLVDGMAGMRLLLKSMSTSAVASKKLPPPWEVTADKSGSQTLPVPTPAGDTLPALRKLASEGLNAIVPVLGELRSTYGDYRSGNPDLAMFGQAPKTIFNQKISATRRFAGQSYSTPRIRKVADAYHATVNDVVLAMCASTCLISVNYRQNP
jgi:diacylglycerol O-acyltransferase / wax synthase